MNAETMPARVSVTLQSVVRRRSTLVVESPLNDRAKAFLAAGTELCNQSIRLNDNDRIKFLGDMLSLVCELTNEVDGWTAYGGIGELQDHDISSAQIIRPNMSLHGRTPAQGGQNG